MTWREVKKLLTDRGVKDETEIPIVNFSEAGGSWCLNINTSPPPSYDSVHGLGQAQRVGRPL